MSTMGSATPGELGKVPSSWPVNAGKVGGKPLPPPRPPRRDINKLAVGLGQKEQILPASPEVHHISTNLPAKERLHAHYPEPRSIQKPSGHAPSLLVPEIPVPPRPIKGKTRFEPSKPLPEHPKSTTEKIPSPVSAEPKPKTGKISSKVKPLPPLPPTVQVSPRPKKELPPLPQVKRPSPAVVSLESKLPKHINAFNEIIKNEESYHARLQLLLELGNEWKKNQNRFLDKIEFKGTKKIQQIQKEKVIVELNQFFKELETLEKISKELLNNLILLDDPQNFETEFKKFADKFQSLKFDSFLNYSMIYYKFTDILKMGKIEKGKNLLQKEFSDVLPAPEKDKYSTFNKYLMIPLSRTSQYPLTLLDVVKGGDDKLQGTLNVAKMRAQQLEEKIEGIEEAREAEKIEKTRQAKKPGALRRVFMRKKA